MYKIIHLDCGRKYFTKNWILSLIDEAAAAGFNCPQLAFGNNGMRFLLDDMAAGSYSGGQVTKAIEAGNAAYSQKHNTETNSLTQSEMDEIIAAAEAKDIQIVPLFDTPGHMDAVITALEELGISEPGYHGSVGSVDFDNAEAVSFVKELFRKYVTYFAGKGCRCFNIGADEYANDVYLNYPGMGFGRLTDTKQFDLFAAYVNELAGYINDAGMTPWAFNDGICYRNQTEPAFDKNIQVCYWTSGWCGYELAPAADIAEQGHALINTNGEFYYILGKKDKFDEYGAAYGERFENTAFAGGRIDNPAGSMFCIWCDEPDAETEQEIAEKVHPILQAIGKQMNL